METGYGLKLNPYHCTAEQLNDAISKLLNDTELQAKMKAASARILGNSQRHKQLADLIETLTEDWWTSKTSKKKSTNFRWQSLFHPWKAKVFRSWRKDKVEQTSTEVFSGQDDKAKTRQ